MTPLAPLVTAFFRTNLAAEKGVSKNTITSTVTRSSSCVDTLAAESGRRLRLSASKISTHGPYGTFWNIWNESAATRRAPETYG